jgi:hypothetical protein
MLQSAGAPRRDERQYTVMEQVRAGAALGAVHGFDWETVEPCEGMHVGYYRATPLVQS